MMLTRDRVKRISEINILALIYFAVAFIELAAEFFMSRSVVFVSRVVTPILLLLIYKKSSERPNPLVYTLFLLLLMTNVLFFYKDSPYFFIAVMISVMQRLVMFLIIFRLISEKRLLYIILASLPFFIIFYYLNSITSEFPMIEINALFFQSILISLLGGISLSGYLKNDNRQNSWLLISILLFIGLQFVVFIERYFFTVISLRVFGLIGIVLNAFGFFTFYKFVAAAEKDKHYV